MSEHVQTSPIPLKVTTFKVGSDDIEFERVIDHASHGDRVWLGKHCYWAFRNGYGVETEPLPLA